MAFVDRADIKAYIGPPSVRARYEMLRSCVAELMRVGILAAGPPLLSWLQLQDSAFSMHSAPHSPGSRGPNTSCGALAEVGPGLWTLDLRLRLCSTADHTRLSPYYHVNC